MRAMVEAEPVVIEEDDPVDAEPVVVEGARPVDSASSFDHYMDNLRAMGDVLLTAEQEVDLAMRIEAGEDAQAVLDIRETRDPADWEEAYVTGKADRLMYRMRENADRKPSPEVAETYRKLARQSIDGPVKAALASTILSGDVLGELMATADDGRRCRNFFVESNLPLVISIVRKQYAFKATPGFRMTDMIQEGNLGLMHAAGKFDYRRGYKFSTYATIWVRQYILRGFANQKGTIRVPLHAREELGKLATAERELTEELERRPSRAEVAARLKKPEDYVRDHEEFRHRISTPSLHKPVGGEDDDRTLNDLLADNAAEGLAVPDQVASQDLELHFEEQLRRVLTEQEARAFELREAGRSHDEIRAEAGFTSRDMVRKALAVANVKLMHPASVLRSVIEEALGSPGIAGSGDRPKCKAVGVEAMFVRGAAQNRVKLICGGCALIRECRWDGLAHDTQAGVWGGLSERERRKMLNDNPSLAGAARSRSSLYV